MEENKGFSVKTLTNAVSLPTLIIGVFWILLLVLGVVKGLSFQELFSDSFRRFGRWGILTLAMVPAIKSGTGPNFALPIGIVCGLLAEMCAIVFNFTGFGWVIASMFMGIIFASLVGYGYGKLMNAVKGSEMAIATYTGFAATMVFSILWLNLPFRDPRILWPLGKGTGVRQTIQLDQIGSAQILDNLWTFQIGGINIPTGMLLVFFFFCFVVYLFTKSKMGIAIAAGGSNPVFASAAGLNVDRGRIMANVVSTVLGAIGIVVYDQSFGYSQLYVAPLYMAFPAVAAVLIGGASVGKVKVVHVIVGAFIFQGIMTTSMPVANEWFAGSDLSETLRQIIQNGVILYALVQAGGRK